MNMSISFQAPLFIPPEFPAISPGIYCLFKKVCQASAHSFSFHSIEFLPAAIEKKKVRN